MAVQLVKDGPEWILRLSGVVDIAEAGVLHASAREAARGAPRAVVVNLRQADSLDTSATQILLGLQEVLATSGRAFRVEDTPPALAETWRRAGLHALTG